ncbi:MAG: CpaF family protein [Oscillospiraceae bacterium]|nr:CpaF family protein [Oscillospiraceae bacterium]
MGLLDRMNSSSSVSSGEHSISVQKQADNENNKKRDDEFLAIKKNAHTHVIYELNRQGNLNLTEEYVKKVISDILEREASSLTRIERNKIATELYNDTMGYGPIEELLSDPNVTEIMVNGPHHVFYEQSGKIKLSELTFRDDEHVMNIIDRIVSSIGRHIDEASPMVDARLADGSRVNAVIPPISLVGPVITIRKFSKKPFTAEKLIEFGSVTRTIMSFLEAAVKGRMNIIVSGGTGSGKTTLLNVLSSFIPENERIVTIEDAAELQLVQQHVVTLEARPANLEGHGSISIRDLVKNALRMRPDRIIVGEVRSGEALDMLQAMNTGHDGSLTTTHANSPRDTIARIETMVLMSGMDLPLRAIREQIAAAIDIIVQQSRMRDGTRKIVSVSEVCGMEGDTILMQEIFNYKTLGQLDSNGKFKGMFQSTGIKPLCLDKIRENGVAVNDEWFQ